MASDEEENFFKGRSSDDDEQIIEQTKSDGLFNDAFASASRTGRIRKKSAKLIEMESMGHIEVDETEMDERKANQKLGRNFIINMNQNNPNISNQAIFKVKPNANNMSGINQFPGAVSLNPSVLQQMQNQSSNNNLALQQQLFKLNSSGNVNNLAQRMPNQLVLQNIQGNRVIVSAGGLLNQQISHQTSHQQIPLNLNNNSSLLLKTSNDPFINQQHNLQIIPPQKKITNNMGTNLITNMPTQAIRIPTGNPRHLINLNNLTQIRLGPSTAGNRNVFGVGNSGNTGPITLNASQLQNLQGTGQLQLNPNILNALKGLQGSNNQSLSSINIQQFNNIRLAGQGNLRISNLPSGGISFNKAANADAIRNVNAMVNAQMNLNNSNNNMQNTLLSNNNATMTRKPVPFTHKKISLGGYSSEYLALHGNNLNTSPGQAGEERAYLSPTSGRLRKPNGQEIDDFESSAVDLEVDGIFDQGEDGNIIDDSGRRKYKRKRKKVTAYSLFCANQRKNIQPGLDFGQISRLLGDSWTGLGSREKMIWKRRAKKLTEHLIAQTGPEDTPTVTESRRYKNRPKKYNKKNKTENGDSDSDVDISLIGTEFIDSAAHLKLLGESLLNLGELLQDHMGPIAVQGSLSVLLDSLICSLGPLICLTVNIPGFRTTDLKAAADVANGGDLVKKNRNNVVCQDEFRKRTKESCIKIFDSIAYIMPGL